MLPPLQDHSKILIGRKNLLMPAIAHHKALLHFRTCVDAVLASTPQDEAWKKLSYPEHALARGQSCYQPRQCCSVRKNEVESEVGKIGVVVVRRRHVY